MQTMHFCLQNRELYLVTDLIHNKKDANNAFQVVASDDSKIQSKYRIHMIYYSSACYYNTSIFSVV